MKPALLVIGPSRSGSSALTAVIGLMGGTLPATLLPAGHGNERGHFESKPLMELNTEAMALHGIGYWDPVPIPPAWFASAEATAYARRIAALIIAEYGDAALPVIKDPRLCRLAPLYLTALAELGRSPRAVIPLRHPGEAASSLAGRDGTLAETAELLQIRELLGAERFTRGVPRAFSRFDALLSDWRGAMAHLADALDLRWPLTADDAAAGVAAFLAPELRHFVHVAPHAGPLATRLWDAILAGLAGDETTLRGVFDAVAETSDEFDRLGGPWQMAWRQRALAAEAQMVQWVGEGAGARAALAEEIAALRGSFSWRVTAPLRALGRLLGR
jgi:hypothetical protein